MAAGLTNIYALLTFLVILAVLVFFHELGHFGAAKLFKMRVEEFALGFGRRLVRVAYDGETEYTIRAIPLGGFVRIAGMEIEDAVERRLTGAGDDSRDEADAGTETTNTQLLEQEAAEVDNAVEDGFNSRPLYQRFIVILAGPVFSLLLGWLIFCLIGVVVGIPSGPPTSRIAMVVPGGAADKAGLKAGETIIAINGEPIANGEAMIKRIHSAPDTPLSLTVRSAESGATRVVSVTPKATKTDDDKTVGLIGIAPDNVVERVGLAKSFEIGNRFTVIFFQQLGGIFARWEVKENLGGPIRIFQETQKTVQAGGPSSMLLAAQLSLSLGVFNLFPIPILDGGHLALLTLEGIRGRKLTAEQTQKVLTAGFAIIVLLFVFIMFNDISKLFGKG